MLVKFGDFALEIDDVAQHNAVTTYGQVESTISTITSLSLANATVWPFFTVPNFEIHIKKLLTLTGSNFAVFSPIITNDTKDLWEQYSLGNQGWIQESLNFSGFAIEGLIIPPIAAHLFPELGTTPNAEMENHYLPVWQTFPPPKDPPSIINFNLLSDERFHRIFDYVEATKRTVLSEVLDVTALFGAASPNSSGHPHSLLVMPILSSFDDRTSKLVGIFTTVIPWDIYFQNIIHKGADGIICVVQDSCGDSFTYRINGPEAHHVGWGDLHDKDYDHLQHTAEFAAFLSKQEGRHLSTVDCHYSLYIYPTVEFHSQYTSRKPAFLTAAVVSVFFFTATVFFAYDILVERRQKLVLSTAERSNAIVSSLFPAEIRDRLFKSSESRKAKRKNEIQKRTGFLPGLPEAPKIRLKTFLNENLAQSGPGKENEAEREEQVLEKEIAMFNEFNETKPIADLFPNPTVMFADIGGFTAWSSVREPTQVFTLLETLYRAFDR